MSIRDDLKRVKHLPSIGRSTAALRAAVARHRITRIDLAKALAVPQPQISRWLTGKELTPVACGRLRAAITQILEARSHDGQQDG